MTLYHGSYLAVHKPNISFSRDDVDFGKGFYTTPIKEQAISWAKRFRLRRGQSVVSTYETDIAILHKKATILTFDEHSEAWFDFVVACRRGQIVGNYDLVVGGVANDNVFDTIQLYLDGLIGKAESIKRLVYDKPNVQYCFRSQAVIDAHLKFLSSEDVTDDR